MSIGISKFFSIFLVFLFFILFRHFVQEVIQFFCGFLYLAHCFVEGPMFISENHHLIMERSFSLQRQLLRDAVASRSVFALFYASVCLYVPDVLSGDDHLADVISH